MEVSKSMLQYISKVDSYECISKGDHLLYPLLVEYNGIFDFSDSM